jgi:hypothetical protein
VRKFTGLVKGAFLDAEIFGYSKKILISQEVKLSKDFMKKLAVGVGAGLRLIFRSLFFADRPSIRKPFFRWESLGTR